MQVSTIYQLSFLSLVKNFYTRNCGRISSELNKEIGNSGF